MQLLYSLLAATYTLTLPDFSQSLVAGLANSIIGCCYFAIASLISLGLWRSRQSGFDTFATVTAGIFWSCAFSYSGHAAEYLGLPHSPVLQTMSDWITVVPAIAFLSLSNRYSFLVGSTEILQSKKDTEQALSETTQRFQAVFDRAFQFIALLEPDGTLLEANQTALELGDLQPSEAIGLKFWYTPWWISSPTNQQRIKANIRQVSAGNFVREEYEITGLNNQVTVLDLSLKPLLNEAGEVFQILAEGRDITQRKQTEAQLQQLTAELEQRVNERTEQISQTNTQLQQEILDRVAIEQQLKASEQFLNNILNAIPDPIYVKDEQHRWITLNDAFCQYLGRSRSELIGKSYRDFLSKEQADTFRQKDELVFSLNTSSESQETLTDTAGNTRFLSTKKSIFVDASDNKILVCAIRDITDRQRVEEMLRDRERLFRAIFDQSFQFVGLLDPDGTVLEANQTALASAGLQLEDIVGTPFWETLWWQISPETKQQVRNAIARAAAGEVIRYEVDVLVAGGAVATVDFSLKPIKDDDGKVVLLIPEGRDISDRKALERELTVRQARFDAFFAAASAGMFITDDQLRFVQFNQRMAELGGQPVSAYIGKTIWECEPAMASLIGPLYEQVLTSNLPILNLEISHPTTAQPDVIRDWLASYFPLPGEDGKPIGIAGFILEVTDRKNLERELALRQARFDAFFAAAPAAMFIFDDHLRFVQVNEKMVETTGPSVAEHLGKTVREVVPEMVHTLEPILEGVLTRNEPILNIEVSGITLNKPGVLRSWLASYFPLPGENGKPIGVGGVAVEITDRKQAEEERDRFFTLSLDLLCIVDFEGKFKRVNPAWETTLGYTRQEIEDQPFINFIHPDDRVPSTNVASKVSTGIELTFFENRYLCKDGSYKWVSWKARPLLEENILYAVGRDITEEKESQQRMQQLAESQERLLQELKTRQNALDESAIVSETDPKGMITYVNEKFTQISGYSAGELLNRDHRIVNSGYHPKSVFQEMWLTISRGLVWKGEIKNRRKDGSFYWVDSTIAPIFDTSGQIVKYIGIRFEITERKEGEERLEKLAAERKAEADSMTQQVLKLLGEIKGAAQGDLTVKAEVTNDVLGAVADSFNFLIGSLRKVVTGIQTLAEQVTSATGESINNTSELTKQAEIQATKISSIMREIERIVNSIRDVRDVSVRAETVAQQSSHTAEVGGMAVDRAVEGINELRLTIASTSKMMKRLGESSQQIGKIVTSISQLASQTNLLALNATIEAARAGEQGLGFAVVAEEVRKLAERSAGATEEISEIVGTIQEEISRVMKAMESGTLEVVEGTKLASEAKTHLNAIIEVSREMNALVQNITRASAKQTVSAEEISNSMQQVNEIATTTAQKGSDVKASLDDLSGSVDKLQKSVANFRS